MAISNFPAALVPIIQTGYLERAFQQGLRSKLAFREIADREEFSVRVGETITKTRAGLKAPALTPMTPANNTNFDNGMTPSGWAVEQYTLTLNQYGDTIDLNTVTDRVGIASQFVQNAIVNGVQASTTLDRLARDALFAKYLGGATSVKTTLGAPGTALAVDDIRGFQTVFIAGVPTPIGAGANAMAITVNGATASATAAVADVVNVSSAIGSGGISGVLTTAANVSVANGTAGNAVLSAGGATVLRPAGRATSGALIAADLLTMSVLLDAVALLRRNNVPTISGYYNLYCDPVSARELFADADFKLLFSATGNQMSPDYRKGMVSDFLGLRFITTTEAYTQALAGVGTIHRPVVCGQGALVEGVFAGMDAHDVAPGASIISMVDDVVMCTREPLDRLQQIIAQSWYTILGYAVPTDTTVNTNIVPTATNTAYKRAVVIEHV